MVQPTVGRTVHYVSHGTPVRADGTQAYPSVCRAAIVTEVGPGSDPNGIGATDDASLAVLNPTGMFFNRGCAHDEDAKAGGTWHWPERAEEANG